MSTEIERKYLVVGDAWRAFVLREERYRQGYVAKTRLATIRVRCAEGAATLTIKGPRRGIARRELAVDVPLEIAEEMLRTQCLGRVIEKVRHFVEFDGLTWHVDVFSGRAAGLVLAEIELQDCDQTFLTPPWAGAEVTHDLRYHNSTLALGIPLGLAAAVRRRRNAEGATSASRPDTTLTITH